MSSACLAKFGSSLEKLVHSECFSIGDVSVEIASASARNIDLPSRLEAFRVNSATSDVAVRVEWLPVLPNIRGRLLFDSGCTWRLFESDNGLRFDFYVAALGWEPYKRLFIDEQFASARLQMSEEACARMPYELAPLDYPLDELLIMHRLTQEEAIELHGCGIVRADGAGDLFVGHSGAGKSTTTRLWSECEDVVVLSDDRIIVRRDAVNSAEMSGADEVRMYGTPWHGDAAYALPDSAPLARIFVLEHGHGNVLTPLSPSDAVAELFARSFVPFHRHEYVESALGFLENLAQVIPCYRYAFEPDARAIETIQKLRD
jgi:hypothetical protein